MILGPVSVEVPHVEGVTVRLMPLLVAAESLTGRFPVEVFLASGSVPGAGYRPRVRPVPLKAEAAHDLIWRPAAYVHVDSFTPPRRVGDTGIVTYALEVLGFVEAEAREAYDAVCAAILAQPFITLR